MSAELRAQLDATRHALDTALDVLVERWHEWTDDGRTLAEFMELTDDQYKAFAEQGAAGYVRAVFGGTTQP